jgi:acyl-CoA dehydrogenase
LSVAVDPRPASYSERRPRAPFTEELEEFRAVVRRWVERELAPHVDEWERDHWFPNEVFARCAEQGYLGLAFAEEDGGEGGGPLAAAVFVEELQRCGSGGVAAGIWAHAGIALPPVAKFGTDEQRRRYLEPGLRGEKIAALGITEPGAGSDVAGIATRANRVDGGYVVNGSKLYITNGVRADFIVTAVKTTDEGGHGGLSFLVVERGEGVEASPLEKLGWHASDTAVISFDDVFVPEENLLGEENRGFYLIVANFQWERLLMALGAVGAMQFWFERTLEYARERTAFGRPIGRLQAIRHKLADAWTTLEAGRTLTYDALALFAADRNPVNEVTMAKLFTQRACVDVLDACLQIHGGAGYMVEYGIERALRDARLGPIGGGSDEIMREILGKSLGL